MADQPSEPSKAGLSPGDHLGRYRIIGLLGAGGMGVVYRAHDPRLERDVALKVMRWSSADAEQIARFSREARAAGGLNHPNIVAVHDVGTEGGVPYVVTELLEGETLRERLHRGKLPFRKAVEYGVHIAYALDAAHQKGICHRDVKPGNVFITHDGRVKLLDFGIAKLRELDAKARADAETADVSQTGAIRGTPGYMSPEQVLGQTVDHRTDIFALGTMLYEMFTGTRPFQRASTVETMHAVLHADPVEPLTTSTSLSASAAALVRHCLEKNKEERFQSARDLAFHLQQLNDLTGSVGPQKSHVTARQRKWRSAGLAAAVLLGGVALTLLLWWMFTAPAGAPIFEQLTFRRARIGGARFASNGAGVIYSEASQSHDMDVLRLELGDNPTSTSLNYPPGTDILAVRGGDLALLLAPRFVQGERFVGTLAVPTRGGAPQEIGKNVEYADWSGLNELAVVVSTLSGTGDNQIEFPQGQPVYKTRNVISFLRVSPDKQRVAFIEEKTLRRSPSGVVSIVDRNKNRTELTGDWENARGLAWSANGREIWFTAGKQGANRALRAVTPDKEERLVFEAPGSLTLWDITSDGKVLVTLDEERRAVMAKLPDEELERDFSWFDQSGLAAISRDGRSLLCGDRNGVYVRRTNELRPHLLTMPSSTWADDLSRDGTMVLATTGSARLVLLPTAGGSPQVVPDHGIVEYRGAYWFPDGRRILFNGSKKGEDTRSYVQDITDGSAPRAITPVNNWGVVISPKGDWIAGPSKNHAIMLWPVDGGASKSVPSSEDGERPLAWSEDGQSLWFFRRGQIPAEIYKLNINTGQRDLWKTIAPPDLTGVYSIVEFKITPDGKAYAYSYSRLLSQLYLVRNLK